MAPVPKSPSFPLLHLPRLSLALSQSLVLTYPSKIDPNVAAALFAVEEGVPNEITEDPLIRGTVVLSLGKRKRVKYLKVHLEGLCDAYGGQDWQYESSSTLKKEVRIDLDGEVFEKGEHAFNFSFIIPSSTAVQQRCSFGRVRHFVQATVVFSSKLAASVSSLRMPLRIIATPAAPGELPDAFSTQLSHYSEELGPILIDLSSPHLTLSSSLSVGLRLLAPPSDFTLLSVTGFILQAFEISYEDVGKVARPPPRKYLLPPIGAQPGLDSTATQSCGQHVNMSNATNTTLSDHTSHHGNHTATLSDPIFSSSELHPGTTLHSVFESSVANLPPLAQVYTGTAFTRTGKVRIPSEDLLRPTTLKGEGGRIRASHRILFELRWRKAREDGSDHLSAVGRESTGGLKMGVDEDETATEENNIALAKTVNIAHCCCLRALQSALPAYEPETTRLDETSPSVASLLATGPSSSSSALSSTNSSPPTSLEIHRPRVKSTLPPEMIHLPVSGGCSCKWDILKTEAAVAATEAMATSTTTGAVADIRHPNELIAEDSDNLMFQRPSCLTDEDRERERARLLAWERERDQKTAVVHGYMREGWRQD